MRESTLFYNPRRNWGLESMVLNFVWLSVNPAWRQQVAVGSADRRFRSLQSMTCGIVTRGSKPCGEARCSTTHGEIGSSNLWLPISCSIRRQQAAVGTADLLTLGEAIGGESINSCSNRTVFLRTPQPKTSAFSGDWRKWYLQLTEKLRTPIYGSQFRVLSGGSKWPSALPTCRQQGGRQPCRPAQYALTLAPDP